MSLHPRSQRRLRPSPRRARVRASAQAQDLFLTNVPRKGSEKGKGKGKKEPEKPYLRVAETAGVELTATCWGMHVDVVDDEPGQPYLTAGCTITAIDGANLLGLEDEDRS